MKWVSFLFLFCSFSSLCFCQVFPQGNVDWITVYQTYPCASSLGYHLWHEKLTGDTIIDNHTYQKLSYQPLCIVEYQSKTCPPFEQHENLPPIEIGAIRQENEKVYFYKFDVSDFIFDKYEYIIPLLPSNQETLLYDFTWSVGDTVRVYVESGLYRTYQVIDDELIDGMKNLMLRTLFAFAPDISVIEGIGETRGIFGMYYYPTLNHDDLLEFCFYQDGELLESHPQCNVCGTVSIHDLTNDAQLNIYPNPTSDELWIDARDISKPFALLIFNSTGQLIYADYKFQADRPVSLQSLGLKGWLFLTVGDKYGDSHFGKVFVN